MSHNLHTPLIATRQADVARQVSSPRPTTRPSPPRAAHVRRVAGTLRALRSGA